MSAGNRDKTRTAPVMAVIGMDMASPDCRNRFSMQTQNDA